MNRKSLFARVFLALVAFVMIIPAAALAAGPSTGFVQTSTQLWVLGAGFLVPAVAYVLNHNAPWASEPVKAFVLVIVAAVAGGVVQAIDIGGVGFNHDTLQVVMSSVVAALSAHKLFWHPSEVAARLGGGSNA